MRRSAFTLIELMVAMAIAMVLAGVTIVTFMQVRSLIRRSEAKMAMYDSASVIYAKFSQSAGALMQHCALVAQTDSDSVDLIFMRGKEDAWDWKLWKRYKIDTDMVWEEWRWVKSKGIFYQTSSTPLRTFTNAGQPYDALPQPRRYLDDTNPRTTLDDNRYFQHSTVAGDDGDGTDLANSLRPVLQNVSDLKIQLIAQDGTVSDLAAGANSVLVRQGVWMDGRISDTISAAPTDAEYGTSSIAKRPKLIRLRFTLTDNAVDPRAPLSQTFSFSFDLPGLAVAR